MAEAREKVGIWRNKTGELERATDRDRGKKKWTHPPGDGYGPGAGGTDSGPCKYTCGEREILRNIRFFRDALRKNIDG
jgi:hypothetical protein